MRGAVALALVCGAAAAFAQTDHDNLDAGRPLRFEDAEPVAFRTLALEYGLGLGFSRRRSVGVNGDFELIYGSNLNGQLEIGFEELAYLYSFRQEIGNVPAMALKAEARFAGGARLRAIATKTVGRYDRLHANLDLDFSDGRAQLGGVLGYSHPLGYPREFNTTGLAEIAFVPGARSVSLGLGVRRQISPRAVLDFGVQSDLSAHATPLRLVAGYSTSF
ncbi:hypothetical protein EON79_12825 [bacterium]|nr:MAG: hypothetical protein EON79_12825 [bacterium]